MKIGLFVLAALLFWGVYACAQEKPPPDKNFYVFLAFGQSNMEGYPGVEEQDKGPVDPRFQMMAPVDFPDQHREKGHWYPAVPPLSRPGAGINPCDYFGRTLVTHLPANVKVGIINVSVAGCKIEMFDKEHDAAYAETAPPWMKGIIAAYGGDPYQRLVDMAKLAQKDGVIKGILLHQGESNTGDKEWPNKVKGVYDNLLHDLNLNAKDVPLLAGELVNADQNGACASMNAIIDDLPKTIPTASVISSAGCPCRPDHLHFTPAGYRTFGTRYGEKMLSLLGVPSQNVTAYHDLPYAPNGGKSRTLDLYLPTNAKNPALILMIHGGQYLFGDKKEENVSLFLNAGFAVASINYRLSSEAIFPAQITDCKAAVRWLRAHAGDYGYDPDRVGAFGESAGGHLASLLGTCGDTKVFDVGDNLSFSSHVQAVGDFYGPTDFLQMDAHRLPNSWQADPPDSPASRLIGGPIQQNKTKTERANPVVYIGKHTPPFYIAHGDRDMMVPYHQSVLLAEALKKARVPVQFHTVSGAGHGFQDATADRQVVAFFKDALAPSEAP